MNVLIGCEESGVVRRAFRALGHDAWSCDIQSSADDSTFHIQGDVFDAINSRRWDLGIFHPPCTFLALCQIWRIHPSKEDCEKYGLAIDDETWRLEQRALALEFFRRLWESDIPRICIEQPKSIAVRIAPKTQTIHPQWFGHGEKKETWLWLKNLPPLWPTKTAFEAEERVWRMPPGPNRKRDRSRTYQGVADAMAAQWSNLPPIVNYEQSDMFNHFIK